MKALSKAILFIISLSFLLFLFTISSTILDKDLSLEETGFSFITNTIREEQQASKKEPLKSKEKSSTSEKELETSKEKPSTSKEGPETSKEVRGLWIASVYNLDFPSKPNLSEETLKKEIEDIIKNAKAWGINTLFFQVRPMADALYKSNIFPVSKVLNTENTSALSFDPLEYIIMKSHEAGIELHAWINPLRVSTESSNQAEKDLSFLPKNSPARKNPDWTIKYADGKTYFDPAFPEVRQLIIDGVLEIIRNYNIDGIHFDDYFYPYPLENGVFDDAKSYIKYGKNLSLEDFRRENINSLIKQVYTAIKSENPQVLFGISPFAVWKNKSSDILGSDTNAEVETYNDIYADTRKWVKEEMIDYICPQIYWSMNQTNFEFNKVFDWWEDCVSGTNVDLIIGHTLAKIGSKTYGWDSPLEIINQIEYSKKSKTYGGSVFFRYSDMLKNPLGISERLANLYSN